MEQIEPSLEVVHSHFRQEIGSERAADNILECLSVCNSYREQLTEHRAFQFQPASKQPIPVPVPPPLMMAYQVNTPEDFLLEILKRIRTSELEEALLILPFTSACELLQSLPAIVERSDQTELVCSVLFLLTVHHAPMVANLLLLPLLRKIQKKAANQVADLRGMVGYNLLHGLQYLEREIEVAEGVQLFRDASREQRKKEKKRKQREKAKRSVMILNG